MEENFSDETNRKQKWKYVLLKLKVWVKFLPILLILSSILIFVSYNIGKFVVKEYQFSTEFEEIIYLVVGVATIIVIVVVLMELIIFFHDIISYILKKEFICDIKKILKRIKELINRNGEP